MSTAPGPEPGTPLTPPSLLRALQHLLRPLVRLLLSHQVTYPLLTRLLKTVYVDVADRELAQGAEHQTASRLAC